jgi:hypothetical protein
MRQTSVRTWTAKTRGGLDGPARLRYRVDRVHSISTEATMDWRNRSGLAVVFIVLVVVLVVIVIVGGVSFFAFRGAK